MSHREYDGNIRLVGSRFRARGAFHLYDVPKPYPQVGHHLHAHRVRASINAPVHKFSVHLRGQCWIHLRHLAIT